MRLPVVLGCSWLLACAGAGPSGGASAPRSSAGGECAARPELAQAEVSLATCHADHASDPGWPARGAFDALVPRLASHLASLDPPREVTTDEVQPLAEGIWELLDQVDFPPGSEPARGRAEDAAEALLRDRGERAAPGAAIEALDAVTQLGAVADPSGGADPCAAEALRVAEARAGATTCASVER